MRAEQLPGTLFVLVTALAAWMMNSPVALLILALGCAAGWVGESEPFSHTRREWALWLALALWAAAYLYLVWRIMV